LIKAPGSSSELGALTKSLLCAKLFMLFSVNDNKLQLAAIRLTAFSGEGNYYSPINQNERG